MGEPLVVSRDEDVVTITINRPEAANAINASMLASFGGTIASLETGDARAVILTGVGDRAFCAGADLKERAGMEDEDVRQTVDRIRRTLDALARLPMPTIAAINGVAFGGGTELALACDIRLAAPTAYLGLTETTLAIIPGGGGTQRLPRLVGIGRAKEMIFTGRRVPANEALQIGLVEEVADDVRERAREMAARIAANGPVAVRAAKQAIVRGLELPLSDALGLEGAMYERTIKTDDRAEGLTAFREKRPPVYRGE